MVSLLLDDDGDDDYLLLQLGSLPRANDFGNGG